MAKIKIRRTHREELPGLIVLRDAATESGNAGGNAVLDLDMGADPELDHLISHDPDGFLSAIEKDETVGFASAHIRSRQCIITQLFVLRQHRGKGAGEELLKAALNFGERSGAREYLTIVPVADEIQGLLMSHQFDPIGLVHRFRISPETAGELGHALAAIMPGLDATNEVLKRQGQADVDRIDQVSRHITRGVDHQFWMKTKQSRISLVRQGQRIAGYAFGGARQIGPVAGSTQDAALCALGRAVLSAHEASSGKYFEIFVPAAFRPAVETLLEYRVPITGTLVIYGRKIDLNFDRVVFGLPVLP